MADQAVLIHGFLNEITNNRRSYYFSEMLKNADADEISTAHSAALRIIETQRNLLDDVEVDDLSNFDFESKIEEMSDIPIRSTTNTSVAPAVDKFKIFSDLLGLDERTTTFCIVEGDSMINAGINNGDIVIVQQTTTANDGDIIIAKVVDKYYLKRYRLIDGSVWLFSENHNFKPIKIPNHTNFQIFGKVRNVVKSIHK